MGARKPKQNVTSPKYVGGSQRYYIALFRITLAIYGRLTILLPK